MITKVKEGMVISLAPNTGAWKTADMKFELNGSSPSVKLTKSLLNKYGESIVRALNYGVLVVGDYQSIDDLRGAAKFGGTSIKVETVKKTVKEDQNADNGKIENKKEIIEKVSNAVKAETSEIASLSISDVELKHASKLSKTKLEIYIDGIRSNSDFVAILDFLLSMEIEKGDKSRKHVVRYLKKEINKALKGSNTSKASVGMVFDV